MLLYHLATAVSSNGTALAQGGSPDIPWLRILFVLLLCIALAFAAVGFLRLRYGLPFLPDRFTNPIRQEPIARNADERLAIVERLGTGPSSQFVILARGPHRYLLHVSQQGVTEIDRFLDDGRTDEQ